LGLGLRGGVINHSTCHVRQYHDEAALRRCRQRRARRVSSKLGSSNARWADSPRDLSPLTGTPRPAGNGPGTVEVPPSPQTECNSPGPGFCHETVMGVERKPYNLFSVGTFPALGKVAVRMWGLSIQPDQTVIVHVSRGEGTICWIFCWICKISVWHATHDCCHPVFFNLKPNQFCLKGLLTNTK
jgi:hypothetical protein